MRCKREVKYFAQHTDGYGNADSLHFRDDFDDDRARHVVYGSASEPFTKAG